jgi:hypothetical protein
MCKDDKGNPLTRIFSIIAMAVSLLAFALNFWQAQVTLRPKISLNNFSIYDRTPTEDGGLALGLQFDFQNKGGTEIKSFYMETYAIGESKLIGKIQSDVVNPIFPQDIFNKAIVVIIPKRLLTPISPTTVKLNESILFKVYVRYPNGWLPPFEQSFYVNPVRLNLLTYA